MALCRILTTIVAIFLSLLVVTVWSFPMTSSNKYPMAATREGLYSDLFQALSRAGSPASIAGSSRRRHPAGTYVDGFGATKHHLNDKDIQEFSWLFNADLKDDVGKRDYGDLGFFFGKRAAASNDVEENALQRQSRDYGDLGMFFGKRSGHGVTDERNMEFPDFAA